MEIILTKPASIPATDPRSIHELIKFDRATYARLSNYKGGILIEINGEILSDIIDYWYEGRETKAISEKVLDFVVDHFIDETHAIPSSIHITSVNSAEHETYTRA